jgi:hypothetical protein
MTVSARNTSKYEADCLLAGDPHAEVDRHGSADVGWCTGVAFKGHPNYIDCHYSAAKNVANSYVLKAAKETREQDRRKQNRESPAASGPPGE